MKDFASAAEALDYALEMLQNTAFPVEEWDDRPMSHFHIKDKDGNLIPYTPSDARAAVIAAIKSYIDEAVAQKKDVE